MDAFHPLSFGPRSLHSILCNRPFIGRLSFHLICATPFDTLKVYHKSSEIARVESIFLFARAMLQTSFQPLLETGGPRRRENVISPSGFPLISKALLRGQFRHIYKARTHLASRSHAGSSVQCWLGNLIRRDLTVSMEGVWLITTNSAPETHARLGGSTIQAWAIRARRPWVAVSAAKRGYFAPQPDFGLHPFQWRLDYTPNDFLIARSSCEDCPEAAGAGPSRLDQFLSL